MAAKEITISLTAAEAVTLRMILDLISGSPTKTKRRHVHSISDKLIDKDVPYMLSDELDLYIHPDIREINFIG